MTWIVLEHDGQNDLGLNKFRLFSGANLKITEEQKLPIDKKNNGINNISIIANELRFINSELLMLFNYLFFCDVKTKW